MEVSLTILIIGNSGSGKTTIIKSLSNKKEEIFPTAGFEISYINIGAKCALVYDCSGEGHSRPLWEMIYQNCDAVGFVIDGQDTERFSVAKQTLHRFIEKNKSMKKKCLCIMINKCDMPSKISKDILFRALDVQKIERFVGKVYLKETSAYTKEGLEESFDWMSKNTSINNEN